MIRAYVALLAFAAVAACAGPIACVDTVHEDQVQALGPEDPAVPPGPLHRPGQPCITCHGGSGPASLQLSLGGTVYQLQGSNQPAVNAPVVITDIDGHTWTGKTNSAGNFFVPLADYAPHYPIQPSVVASDGTVLQMITLDNRDGSCADCHQSTANRYSPGPVFLAYAPVNGGP